MTNPARIDVHHHFVSPKFKEASEKQSEWPTPAWSVEIDQDFNKSQGIASAILSITTPGPEVGGSPEAAASIARDANESGSSIRRAHDKSYGFFASIPSPENMKPALKELAYAFDKLEADGLTLMTSYHGKYLGNPEFLPLWEELNKRNAVVFVHPTSPANWQPVNKALLAPMLDFAFETTKTAMDLMLSGTITRYPNVKFILSHAGGALPYLWLRPAVLLQPFGLTDLSVQQFQEQASNFYFDTALSGNPEVIQLLLKFAKPGHVFFGSDFPYADAKSSAQFTQGLDETPLADADRAAINREGALKLFPRFT